MSDIEAIARLIVVYSHLLDDQRYEEFSQLFTEDATMTIAGRQYCGREAITGMVSSVQPMKPGKHFTGYPVVDVVSTSEANAWSDMVAIFYNEDGTLRVGGLSRYHDVLRKVEGKWLIHQRFMQAPGSETAAGAPPAPRA